MAKGIQLCAGGTKVQLCAGGTKVQLCTLPCSECCQTIRVTVSGFTGAIAGYNGTYDLEHNGDCTWDDGAGRDIDSSDFSGFAGALQAILSYTGDCPDMGSYAATGLDPPNPPQSGTAVLSCLD